MKSKMSYKTLSTIIYCLKNCKGLNFRNSKLALLYPADTSKDGCNFSGSYDMRSHEH